MRHHLPAVPPPGWVAVVAVVAALILTLASPVLGCETGAGSDPSALAGLTLLLGGVGC